MPAVGMGGLLAAASAQQPSAPVGGGIWLVLTLVNAGLAQGKGRSGLAWWLISLFLGPIATLLIVVLPRRPR